jgi:aminopeptidase YwaD
LHFYGEKDKNFNFQGHLCEADFMISKSSTSLVAASAARLRSDWRQICGRIGERRAGGPGERQAADYIARRFSESGLSVADEEFPCRSLVRARTAVAVRAGGRWRPAQALCLVNSASTPGGRAVEGEIAWIEAPADLPQVRRDSMRGKIMVLFGQMPGDTGGFRALLAARPLAILQVDDREPFSWPIQNALLPEWVRQYGAPPIAGIAYQDAWNWRRNNFVRARVAIAAEHRRAPSSNVVATLAGTDPSQPAILFGAHHDTPPGLVGADDNASGVVTLLELARVCAAAPGRRRPMIFASFGTEEQLSVGSAAYVRRHRRGLSRIGLVINFDSVSSVLGHNHLYHSGQAGLGSFFQAELRRHGLEVDLNDTITPFSDHFPFTAFGIPGIWFYRSNIRGAGRWQHHSGRNHDSLANVSPEVLCRLIDAIAPTALALASEKSWPFGTKLPPAIAAQTAEYARKWYGFRV